jgi:hypothetical protein
MKIGDKLKCIDDRNSNCLNATNDYEIVTVNIHDNIQVKELDYPYTILAHFYKPERFMLVEENPAILSMALASVFSLIIIIVSLAPLIIRNL